MRERYKELLVMENDVSMHMQALQSLKTSYNPSAEATDFSRMVKQKFDAFSKSQK